MKVTRNDGSDVSWSGSLCEMVEANLGGYAPTGQGASIRWVRLASPEWLADVVGSDIDSDDGDADFAFAAMLALYAWEHNSREISATAEQLCLWSSRLVMLATIECAYRRRDVLEYDVPSIFVDDGDSRFVFSPRLMKRAGLDEKVADSDGSLFSRLWPFIAGAREG